MSIFNLFGSSKPSELYSDTNSDGEEDAYMYRLERDGTTTPISKSQYEEETKDDWENGYYDDPIFNRDDEDQPKKGWWSLW